MNLKKIICLAIATSISQHAYAFEIYHGKVTGTKMWASKGTQGKFVSGNGKNLLLNKRDEVNFQEVNAFITSDTTTVSQPVTLQNSYGIYVGNVTGDISNYAYYTTICSETSDATEHCLFQRINFELSPGGHFRDDPIAKLTMTYDQPGLYKIYANIFLSQENDPYTLPASSSATGYINVTAA